MANTIKLKSFDDFIAEVNGEYISIKQDVPTDLWILELKVKNAISHYKTKIRKGVLEQIKAGIKIESIDYDTIDTSKESEEMVITYSTYLKYYNDKYKES